MKDIVGPKSNLNPNLTNSEAVCQTTLYFCGGLTVAVFHILDMTSGSITKCYNVLSLAETELKPESC